MAIIRPMAKRKRSEHYVNNKEFLAALIKYQEDIEIARLQDKTKPVIPRRLCLKSLQFFFNVAFMSLSIF